MEPKKIYKTNSTCRLCGSGSLELAIAMRKSPIGDDFTDNYDRFQPTVPLSVYFCHECAHLQNIDVVDPEILFGNYTYRTSHSLGLRSHFKAYASELKNYLNLSPHSKIFEIGSNDGSLLSNFKADGMSVLGIDPSKDASCYANSVGITTLNTYFSETTASDILNQYGRFDLICANNVYAHLDDMVGITRGIKTLLKDDGLFSFEVSYLPDMVENMVFDTIYHEHVSYHSLHPLSKFFDKLSLKIVDVIRVLTKGGSIRVLVAHKSSNKWVESEQYSNMVKYESENNYNKLQTYKQFSKKIAEIRSCVQDIVNDFIESGATISGYGASTTTTTLLYNLNLENLLDTIYDDNKIKHGKYSPGAHILVRDSKLLSTSNTNLLIVLAWVYAKEIVAKCVNYLENGGEILIPLPKIRRITADNYKEYLSE